MSALALDLVVEERNVAVRLDVAEGQTVALLGPNGAGKSTVLGAVAGIVASSGTIALGGRSIAADPPHRRGVALLTQAPSLFPHLSVLDNVAFGPRARGVSRRVARDSARGWLERGGALGWAARRPSELSGGEAQRVAIARALATEPRLLMLDEPFSALDAEVTPGIRHLVRTVLADRTAIVVTHDVLDALLLADRVVVLEAGRVVEDAPTREVLTHPRSAFAARIAGVNLVAGVWRDGAVVCRGVEVRGLPEPDVGPREGDAAVAVFPPSAVSLFRAPPGGSPRTVLRAVVGELEPLGNRVRVRCAVDDALSLAAEITPSAAADLRLSPGVAVWLSVKAVEVTVHPAQRAAL